MLGVELYFLQQTRNNASGREKNAPTKQRFGKSQTAQAP
jgi:hypothetical protein